MSAVELNCPACGGPVRFQSRVSIFAVCPYCSQMLVRRDLDVDAIGKMALLPEDSSPLQIGTQGKFQGKAFTLAGRLLQKWSDGEWTEWFAVFDDGTHGWLAEAQGFFMISFERAGLALPPLDKLAAGLSVPLAGAQYEVEDIKNVTCAGSQGELPFRAPEGRTAVSVDLTGGPDRGFACLDYSSDGARAFVGRYVELDDLAPQNLRKLDGW